MAGEVALEQPGGLASALALGDASGDVVAGSWVVLAAMQRDRVQRPIELAVAAAAEAVPDGLAAGGGQRRDAGEPGEGGFGAQAAGDPPRERSRRGRSDNGQALAP